MVGKGRHFAIHDADSDKKIGETWLGRPVANILVFLLGYLGEKIIDKYFYLKALEILFAFVVIFFLLWNCIAKKNVKWLIERMIPWFLLIVYCFVGYVVRRITNFAGDTLFGHPSYLLYELMIDNSEHAQFFVVFMASLMLAIVNVAFPFFICIFIRYPLFVSLIMPFIYSPFLLIHSFSYEINMSDVQRFFLILYPALVAWVSNSFVFFRAGINTVNDIFEKIPIKYQSYLEEFPFVDLIFYLPCYAVAMMISKTSLDLFIRPLSSLGDLLSLPIVIFLSRPVAWFYMIQIPTLLFGVYLYFEEKLKKKCPQILYFLGMIVSAAFMCIVALA